MDYLPGDCSLNTLNTVYKQQIKPKNVSINSSTTTFLYSWNKTATQSQYEYYLYKTSSYPSKFSSHPNIVRKPKPIHSLIKKTPIISFQKSHPCSHSKKDENWIENWNWDKELANTHLPSTSSFDNNSKIMIPRTTTLDYFHSIQNINTLPVYVPKRKKVSNNPYASKKPLQTIHSPYSIMFSYSGSHCVE